MPHVLRAVLLRYPLQHAPAPGVIEVHVNIRHGDTIGVQEAFEEQVILRGVYVRDAQAVRHRASRGTATPGPDNHLHLPRRPDVVLHNKEVTREAHLLDGFQLEGESLANILRQRLALPTLRCALPRQVIEVVALQLDAQDLVVTVELLVPAELLLQRLLGETLGIRRLRPERFRNRELRHDGRRVEVVGLNLVCHCHRVLDLLNVVGQIGAHLLVTLKPLLLGVAQPLFVRQLLPRAHAEKHVVRLAIFLLKEVNVVRRNDRYPQLLPQLQQRRIHALLPEVEVFALLLAETVNLRLVKHDLQVVVLPEESLIPLRLLLCFLQPPLVD